MILVERCLECDALGHMALVVWGAIGIWILAELGGR